MRKLRGFSKTSVFLGLTAALGLAALGFVPATREAGAAAASDWTQYTYDITGSGLNTAESAITAQTAGSLQRSWVAPGGISATAQPIVVGNVVYWGSWDGNLHATSISTGGSLWTRALGMTDCSACSPTAVGMASTPAFGTINTVPVLWVADGGNDTVGGGQVAVYAVNASDGTIIWRTNIVPVSNDAFAWSSIRVFNGGLFFSTASVSDNPVIQGHIYKLDPNTGNVLANVVVGAGVWGTPTIDTATGMMYVPVGAGSCCGGYSAALIEVDTSNLSIVSSWTIPASQQVTDGDFGSVPTLFDATISGTLRHMVGLGNKNGIFYAWDRTNIAAGPIWEQAVAIGGQAPESGNGTVSPAVWDGTTLYVAGGNTTINGMSCKGSVRALNPATGASNWEVCETTGHVIGALAAAPGILVVAVGPNVQVLSMATGQQLFLYTNASSQYWGAPSVGSGHIFAPAMDGSLTALSPTGTQGVPSITLAPQSQSAPTGTSQTVTATVTDGSGAPISGATVTFQVLSGPNANQTGTGTTSTAGQATFAVTSTTAGMDSIQASFTDSSGGTHTSNPAQATFTSGTPLISNLTVSDTTNAAKWSVQQNLQVGNVLYGDRAYTLSAAPTLVTGAAWIRDANSSKAFTGNPMVTFTLGQQADVFVGLDKRLARPAWIDATWSDTGVTETASNGPIYEVFRKTFAAGSVSLGPNPPTGAAGGSMYTIAAT